MQHAAQDADSTQSNLICSRKTISTWLDYKLLSAEAALVLALLAQIQSI